MVLEQVQDFLFFICSEAKEGYGYSKKALDTKASRAFSL